MVKPHVTIFGQKDYQQLAVIKRMVQDLNMDLEVVGMPTTRETDGLAMSSRNTYLKDEERVSALSLSHSLKMAKAFYEQGERDAGKIIGKASAFISSHPYTAIDYVNICDTKTMQDVLHMQAQCVMALAVKVGKTRLIDNYVFGEQLDI
jgi:pantoate--beta-alanine ligase